MIQRLIAVIFVILTSLGCASTEPKKRNPLFDPPSGNPFSDSYYDPPSGQMEYDEPVKTSSPR